MTIEMIYTTSYWNGCTKIERFLLGRLEESAVFLRLQENFRLRHSEKTFFWCRRWLEFRVGIAIVIFLHFFGTENNTSDDDDQMIHGKVQHGKIREIPAASLQLI